MKKRTETDIQSAILNYLNLAPGKWFRSNTGAVQIGNRFIRFGTPGCPDIIGCIYGRFVGLEIKTAKGRQNKNQKEFQRQLEEDGKGLYFVVRSVDDVIGVVNDLKKRDGR